MARAVGNVDKPASPQITSLNFKATVGFRREFKPYAAQRCVAVLQLLQGAFRLVKEDPGE
jgi:hypothetical protein